MSPNDELLQKIGQVRSKWKAFVWMRGLAWVLGLLVAALAIGIYLATAASVPLWVIRAVSLVFAGGMAVAAVWKLILPLRRVPTDTQLAQFVEEKNPGLEQSLVSAVEAINKPKAEHGAFSFLLVKDALDRTKNVRFAETINKKKFNVFAAVNGGLVVAFLIGLFLASLFTPGGIQKLAAVFDPPTLDEMKLTVEPGSRTVPKGSDVDVKAVLSGYDANRGTIHFKYENGKEWSEAAMDVDPTGDNPTYRFRLFNLQEQVSYYVDISGKRSDEYTIKVADLPRVEKMDYTYHYPAYTGLPSKKEENAYDIIALKGTVVEVSITSNQQLKGGRIVFADKKDIPLTPSGDKQVMGKITVDRNATFRIELTNTNGDQPHMGLEEYRMQATDDQKPVVHFVKPGRDYRATNLEEVFTEAKADDDFGIKSLELVFTVNGGKEQKVDLYRNSAGASPKEISGTHTFFLEEFKVKPGDFVAYYAVATDSRNPANVVK